jgi:hypothetical protein
MLVVRWMHAGAIEGFHRHRRIPVEAIVVLHWGMMVRVVSSIVVPATMVVIIGFLVVHLQLAHIE